MKYFWVEAYDKYGDYEYKVYVDTLEEVHTKMEAEQEEHLAQSLGKNSLTIHQIKGPFKISYGAVDNIKQPG